MAFFKVHPFMPGEFATLSAHDRRTQTEAEPSSLRLASSQNIGRKPLQIFIPHSRTTKVVDDLVKKTAAAFVAVHGATGQQQSAVQLELKTLLTQLDHLGMLRTDPLLGHDIRMILASQDTS